MDPYWQNCPYPDCPIHDHLPVRGEEFNRARWLHHMLPCCRWCEIWQAIAEDMFDPPMWEIWAMYAPEFVYEIVPFLYQMFDQEHVYFKTMARGTWDQSVRVEIVSQHLWALFHRFPEIEWLGELAAQLRILQDDLQVGPHREWYYTMPHPRYLIGP